MRAIDLCIVDCRTYMGRRCKVQWKERRKVWSWTGKRSGDGLTASRSWHMLLRRGGSGRTSCRKRLQADRSSTEKSPTAC